MCFNIKIHNKKINYAVDYKKLKEQVEKCIKEDDEFLQNAKMECRRINNCGHIDFNVSVSALLLSIGSMVISIYKPEAAMLPNVLPYMFCGVILLVMFFSINMQFKRQGVEKIMFVIEEIEKNKTIPRITIIERKK